MFRTFAAIPLAVLACSCASVGSPSWKLTREGVELRRAGTVSRVALPGWQWAGPPYGAALALGTGAAGEVLVTSDVVPTVWRVDPRSLAVTVHPLALDADNDRDVGFAVLVYSRAHAAYFARGALDGACWRIDASLSTAHKFRRGEALPLAAAGMCMQE